MRPPFTIRTRRFVRPTLVGAMLVALVLTSVSLAGAQPSLSDRETARSLMDDGDAKRDNGDIKAALKSYEAADAIMRVPTTGLEVARAQAELGLLLEARDTLGRVMRLPPKPGEPQAFTAARRMAEQLSTELGARIPSVTVVVVVTNGAVGEPVRVVFDGEAVPIAASQAPRRVNPGHHTIIARSGLLEKKEEITVTEAERRTVTVDLKPPPIYIERDGRALAGSQRPSSALPKVLVFGGFGVGLVGIGLGTVTGLMSISQVNDVKKDCTVCPPSRQGDIDSATSLGTVSTVAFIVGGAGVGAGVLGLVLWGRHPKEPPAVTATSAARGLSFAPEVGPAWLGARGTF